MDKGKRNALIAAIALVVLLAGAMVAYRMLGAGTKAGQTTQAAEATQQSTQIEATADGKDEASADPDAIYLADYDATVYTEAGEAVTLTELANGQPLVVNFWATWCPYCVQEMPDFKEIYAEYGDRVAFAFVDVADGSRETVDDAADWLFQNELYDLPAYYDSDLDATAAFGAYSLPTTAVIASDGEILTISPGAIDATLMRASLESLV